jgi:heme/copper-type cytochrome/quinol oxidase subunit 2
MHERIATLFNTYQRLCVVLLAKMKAPKMLVMVIVSINLFAYFFILLGVLGMFVYFAVRGCTTILQLLF